MGMPTYYYVSQPNKLKKKQHKLINQILDTDSDILDSGYSSSWFYDDFEKLTERYPDTYFILRFEVDSAEAGCEVCSGSIHIYKGIVEVVDDILTVVKPKNEVFIKDKL